MKQEDKDLLLKDLCSRLPYGVIANTSYSNGCIIGIVKRQGVYKKSAEYIDIVTDKAICPIRYIKPYLRSMSSMTEEEVDEFTQFDVYADGEYIMPNYKVIDWLNAHHFDYRGFIEKGLAIEVTEENNPYKE